jgi:hypothetical protein
MSVGDSPSMYVRREVKPAAGGTTLHWDDFARGGAAIALLGTSMSVLAVTGTLEQVQRNHAWWLYPALVSVVLAGLFWALSLLARDRRTPVPWRHVGFGIAVGLGVLAAGTAALRWDKLMSKDGPTVALLLAALVAACGLFWSARWLRREWKTELSPVLTAIGATCLAVGLLLGMFAVVLAHKDMPLPRITGSIQTHSPAVLTGRIMVGGVNSEHHVRVTVTAITWKRNGQGHLVRDGAGKPDVADTQPLYSVWLGPDEAGKVDHSLSLALPSSLRDEIGIYAWVVRPSRECITTSGDKVLCATRTPPPCDRLPGQLRAGCLSVGLIQPLERPQISAALKRVGKGHVVSLTVKGQRVRESRALRVRLLGFGASGKAQSIFAANVGADDAGILDGRWQVPVPAKVTRVCAAAMYVASQSGAARTAARPVCPPRANSRTVWTQFIVPPGQEAS